MSVTRRGFLIGAAALMVTPPKIPAPERSVWRRGGTPGDYQTPQWPPDRFKSLADSGGLPLMRY